MEIHWEDYRHSEFLQTLKDDCFEYINLFLRKSDQKSSDEA